MAKLKLNKKNLRVLSDTEAGAIAGGATEGANCTVGTCMTCAGQCNTNDGCTSPCTSVNCTANTCAATQQCTQFPFCGGTTTPTWCLACGGGGGY